MDVVRWDLNVTSVGEYSLHHTIFAKLRLSGTRVVVGLSSIIRVGQYLMDTGMCIE